MAKTFKELQSEISESLELSKSSSFQNTPSMDSKHAEAMSKVADSTDENHREYDSLHRAASEAHHRAMISHRDTQRQTENLLDYAHGSLSKESQDTLEGDAKDSQDNANYHRRERNYHMIKSNNVKTV